jgi:hypothetical protein
VGLMYTDVWSSRSRCTRTALGLAMHELCQDNRLLQLFAYFVQTDGIIAVLGSDLDGVIPKQPNSTKLPGSVQAAEAGKVHAVALMTMASINQVCRDVDESLSNADVVSLLHLLSPRNSSRRFGSKVLGLHRPLHNGVISRSRGQCQRAASQPMLVCACA